MDPIFGVILDVAGIVTFKPNVATGSLRIAQERELESTNAVEFAPAATPATKQEQARRSRWFSFSFMPR